MAKEIQKHTSKAIEITPFGVDLSLFNKLSIIRKKNDFIVGTVKTLAPKYGIDILIESFRLILDKKPILNLKLQIIGDGPDKEKLQELVCHLGIKEYVEFLGKIENPLLPKYYNNFSVFVSVSDSESFGVVAVEAMACECPVIVSDANGFTEVVVDGETGYIVPKRSIEATANAIQKFINDSSLRDKIGKKGRERVKLVYNWDNNVKQMIQIYDKVISKRSNYS
jgi:glycosyltransferase involved in cell wall biosynthesis